MGRLCGVNNIIILIAFFIVFTPTLACISNVPSAPSNISPPPVIAPPASTPITPESKGATYVPALSSQIYKSDLYGYSLQFPSDWNIKVDKSNSSMFREGVDIYCDPLSTQVSISVAGPIRADKYYILNDTLLTEELIKSWPQNSITKKNMISLSDLGGDYIDAYNIEATFQKNGALWRSCFYNIVSDNKWLIWIQYIFPDKVNDTVRPLMIQSLKSFRCK
jgi:hypothetical protein